MINASRLYKRNSSESSGNSREERRLKGALKRAGEYEGVQGGGVFHALSMSDMLAKRIEEIG